MSKTLTLENLAPYLPYMLRVFYKNQTYKMSIYHGFVYVGIDRLLGKESEYKPLLRPLSDLTKQIEHNGETFVPVIELAKLMNMADPKDFKILDDVTEDGTRRLGCCWFKEQHLFWYDPEYRCFEYETTESFVSFNTCASNQLDMFKKLYSWHFDLDGLIEKGLAIDINTVKNLK